MLVDIPGCRMISRATVFYLRTGVCASEEEYSFITCPKLAKDFCMLQGVGSRTRFPNVRSVIEYSDMTLPQVVESHGCSVSESLEANPDVLPRLQEMVS